MTIGQVERKDAMLLDDMTDQTFTELERLLRERRGAKQAVKSWEEQLQLLEQQPDADAERDRVLNRLGRAQLLAAQVDNELREQVVAMAVVINAVEVVGNTHAAAAATATA